MPWKILLAFGAGTPNKSALAGANGAIRILQTVIRGCMKDWTIRRDRSRPSLRGNEPRNPVRENGR